MCISALMSMYPGCAGSSANCRLISRDRKDSSYLRAVRLFGERRTIMKTELQKTLEFSAPLAVAELAYISMVFTDAFLFSLLSVEALAGAGLGTTMLHFVTICSIGLVAGVSNLVSIAYGAKRNADINATVTAGFLISGVLFTIALSLVVMSPWILRTLGQAETIIADAYAYMSVAVWSVLPLLILRVLRGLSAGVGHRISILKISVFGTVLNLPLSYGLMEGLLFLPPLGVAGIGIATSVVALLMCIFFAVDIYKRETFEQWRFWQVTLSATALRRAIRDVLHMGLPIGLAYGMEAGLFTIAGVLAGQLGPTSLAAHQIALHCSMVAFRIPAALAQGTSVLVGQNLGARQFGKVKRHALAGLLLGALFSALSSSIFLIFPDVLARIFISATKPEDYAVAKLAAGLLTIVAVFQLADGFQVIAMGALRGLRQAQMPTLLTMIGYWMVGLPAAYLLAAREGVTGIWWGLALGLTATALMLILFLAHACKQFVVMPTAE